MRFLSGHLLRPVGDWSSALLFHKIHCGAMSIDKDKYLTLLTVPELPGHHIKPNIVDTRHAAFHFGMVTNQTIGV